jgi:hypothetical protein
MNLKDSQLDVDNWIKEHGVRYFNDYQYGTTYWRSGRSGAIIARRYGEQSEKSDKIKI